MGKPEFITFTGADAATTSADFDTMAELSQAYPIEWALLYSRERAGTARYPGWSTFRQLAQVSVCTMAIHLCGEAAREFIDGKVEGALGYMLNHGARRVQINVAGKLVLERGVDAAVALAARLGVDLVLQCRGSFPLEHRVAWLFDQSGGRGKPPEAWEPAPREINPRLVGYAGGIGPDNVAAVVAQLGEIAQRYWIDMESGVRTDERFGVTKVRAVCEAVYG